MEEMMMMMVMMLVMMLVMILLVGFGHRSINSELVNSDCLQSFGYNC